MGKDIIIYLILIYAISLIAFIVMNNKYKFSKLFIFIFSVASVTLGLLSTLILGYFESGSFGNISYFGAVFLLPIFVFLISHIFKIKKSKYLYDFIAILGCITLIIMKIRCYIAGCCGGRIIAYTESLRPIIFPSQIAECINGLILLIILLVMFKKNKYNGKLYQYFMLLYGITRFFLNFFRYYKPIFSIFSISHIWSILSIIVAILLFKKKEKMF